MSLTKVVLPSIKMLARRSLHTNPYLRRFSSKHFAGAPSPHRSDLVGKAPGQKKQKHGKEDFVFDLKNFGFGISLGLVGAKGLHTTMEEQVEWTWK